MQTRKHGLKTRAIEDFSTGESGNPKGPDITHADSREVFFDFANSDVGTVGFDSTLMRDDYIDEQRTNEIPNDRMDASTMVIRVPKFEASRQSVFLSALQEWEGYIEHIDDESIIVRLIDITQGSGNESEEAIIPFQELSEADRNKIELGSIFRWVIGYEVNASGTRKRISQIVFRDLPVVSKSDIETGMSWAKEVLIPSE